LDYDELIKMEEIFVDIYYLLNGDIQAVCVVDGEMFFHFN